jgi:hypothetical protein
LKLFGEVLGPRIAIEPVTHDFGQVGTPTDLALWVSNIGDAPLNVSDITYISTSMSELFLADQGDFSSGSGVLQPGEGTELIVQFAPTDSSTEEGSIHISSNDPTQSVAVASQFGSGMPCEGQPWVGDFFVQTYDDSEIRLYPSNGDGTFATHVVIGDALGELFAGALVVGDFDGDASMDILAKIRPSVNDTYRLVQFSYDACEEDWLPTVLLNAIDFTPSGAADLNQDGTLDVFGYSAALGFGTTMLNDGVGHLPLFSTPMMCQRPTRATVWPACTMRPILTVTAIRISPCWSTAAVVAGEQESSCFSAMVTAPLLRPQRSTLWLPRRMEWTLVISMATGCRI